MFAFEMAPFECFTLNTSGVEAAEYLNQYFLLSERAAASLLL